MIADHPNWTSLLERFRAGQERALSQAISGVENETPGFERFLDAVHDRVGRARRIGITGPPGAGKSTVTAGVARVFVDQGLRVGILAVDPTSPFTGGALLGDRVRMTELSTEPGVFIRSMASRGSVGGLATAACEAADLMDAFGFDRVLLETLGVGQSELDIASSADTTVVVLVPESGDGIQAMKAGLMEVADLFVVNKADRPGAARLAKEIEVMMAIRAGNLLGGLSAGHHGASAAAPAPPPASVEENWRVPVLETTATTGEGIERLVTALGEHYEASERSGALGARRREQRLERVRAALLRRAEGVAGALWEARRERVAEELAAGRATPYAIAERLYEELRAGGTA
ncbi:MAG: methylmalonyl Co-A mutase-associated GTPase MeaB [Gemmatimonadota bacterium]